MEDEVGTEALDGILDSGPIDEVEGVDVGGQHVEGARLDGREQRTLQIVQGHATRRHQAREDVPHVTSELAVGAGDQHPQRYGHRVTGAARRRRGSHQLRLSAYQPTVSARPFSKGTVGSQPSSRRILLESRR